ncbi:phosphatidylinositol mannoside acyltransferase [Corynebacterium sp. A21]|uniref:phosphatidylinositol mannoside acyltransferase n=1 Tax=Corynebacterium sp. A21 TaxID=3457318 RepID=UPI003FD05652
MSLRSMVRDFDPVALGYLAGWKVIGRLPEPLARGLFRAGADYASGQGRGMDQLRRNLSRVVGPENVTRELVRASVRSYARYWLEAFRLPRLMKDPELRQELSDSVIGKEALDRSLASGRGVILTLPHSGNWDMAGLFLVDHHGSFTTVAERLKPEVLYNAFVDYRESLGFTVLPLTGGTPPFPVMRETLSEGGVICLMGERDLKLSGVPCLMFGEPTSLPAGPVQLARETGAALHVVHCWYPEEGGWGFSISDEVEVGELATTVQRVADLFSANIAAHPADWHMLQPQWTADIEERRRRRRLKKQLEGHE